MVATLLWTLEAVSLAPGRLRGVTLEIRAGVTAMLGCSGAGRTSLLIVLVGFSRAWRNSASASCRQLLP